MCVGLVSLSNGKVVWGAERSLLDTVAALRSRGVECRVILPRAGGVLDAELSRLNVPFAVVDYRWWMVDHKCPVWKRWARMAHNVYASLRIASHLSTWGCDVVYSNTLGICAGALAARVLGLPHVWHIREFVGEDHGQEFILGERMSLKLVDRLSAVIVTNSRAVARKFETLVDPAKLQVVHNPVRVAEPTDAQIKAVPEKTRFRLVLAGRLGEGKGQDDAIRATSELVKGGVTDVELMIVGEGTPRYRKQLDEMVSELGVGEYVRFVGYVDNAFPMIQSGDVALMCSRMEAFGRVTAEAMLAGRVVIGTNTGGTPELVRDGVTGLLYTPQDIPALVSCIRRLMNDRVRANEMGEAGRAWAQQYLSEATYADRMVGVLTKACGPRQVGEGFLVSR